MSQKTAKKQLKRQQKKQRNNKNNFQRPIFDLGLPKTKLHHLIISRDSLEKTDIKAIRNYFIYSHVYQYNELVLTFDGYDLDKREIWEIPETILFFKKLINEVPRCLPYLFIETLAIIIKTLNITDANFILREAEYISEKDFIRLHKKLEVIYSGNLPQSTSECIEFTIKEIYPMIN